ncbi:hypothetical protein TNCV_1331011 [Trichonephila clavipes]|uniref:Uncharacterized protein n=1 Tax=Trichonephila clavipes TaxID=2585209 RepID=A0A8X6RBZ4_TRICX|nr:hypothetical protein TNCV_1331011 [Trichonephila clavipes]
MGSLRGLSSLNRVFFHPSSQIGTLSQNNTTNQVNASTNLHINSFPLDVGKLTPDPKDLVAQVVRKSSLARPPDTYRRHPD